MGKYLGQYLVSAGSQLRVQALTRVHGFETMFHIHSLAV